MPPRRSSTCDGSSEAPGRKRMRPLLYGTRAPQTRGKEPRPGARRSVRPSARSEGSLLMAPKKPPPPSTPAKKPIVRRRRRTVTEEMVRERAYFISISEGGSPVEHWLARPPERQPPLQHAPTGG